MKTSFDEIESKFDGALEELKELGVRGAADTLDWTVRHAQERDELTTDRCHITILLLDGLTHLIKSSTDEEQKYFKDIIVGLMSDIPTFAGASGMAALINGIKRGSYGDWVVPILFSIRRAGFTYKSIKGFMNQYLEQDEREKLGEIIRENKEEVEEKLDINKVTYKMVEALNDACVKNGEEWAVEKAQSEAVDTLAAASESLVNNKGKDFGGSVSFQKGGHRIVMPMLFSNQKEKDRFLQTAQGVSTKLNPDAVILVTDTFTSSMPAEELDKKGLMPEDDPDRKEAIMVAVETPNSKWRAFQYYERDEDNNITLTDLHGPYRKDDMQGNFVFMQNA